MAPDTEQPFDLAARSGDPAFYRADRAAADSRRFFVAESIGAHQYQRFALFGRQSAEGAAEIVKFQSRLLGGRRRMGFKVRRFQWPHEGAVAAKFVEIEISQDGKYPGFEIRPWRELAGGAQRPQNGVLDQIVGPVAVARQRSRKRPQMRQTGQDVIIDAGAQNFTVRS